MIYGLILLKHAKTSTQKQRAGILGVATEKHFHIDKFISFEDKPDLSLFKPKDTIIRFNFLSNKSLEGVVVRVQNGHEPGRKTGGRNVRHILDGKEKSILKMYADGCSMYAIAKK